MSKLPPDGPIYQIPPIEAILEKSIRWDMLAEQRDWGHANLGLRELHDAGYQGDGVLVAICDTGVDPDHPDLRDELEPAKCFDFTGSGTWRDGHGHGTHCMGIAAASQGKDIGIIGAAPLARKCAMKVLSDSGSGSSSWIAAGIRRAAEVGADIISLSLGGSSPDPQTRAAIQDVTSRGCWVVCAAGNDGGPANSYPGHYPESIAVCATDQGNRRASFSTVNTQNDVSAPGVSILSTLPGNRYGTMSGTSMATPYVAGCLALVRAAIKKAGKPMPTQSRLLEAIADTSKDLATPGHDSQTGWGLINTAGLIARFAASPPPPPPPPPTPPPPAPTKGFTGTLVYEDGVLRRTVGLNEAAHQGRVIPQGVIDAIKKNARVALPIVLAGLLAGKSWQQILAEVLAAVAAA